MPALSSVRRLLSEADPDDHNARLVAADALDSDDRTDPRGAVLRAAADVHERVGGVVLPDRHEAFWTESPGWEVVAGELEMMAANPSDTPEFRTRYAALLRGDVPLAPEDLETTLRLQYDLQVRLLTSLNLLDEHGGITAVDGKHYPLPAFDDVLARMRKPVTQRKLTQGFDTLLLVPFGLSLERVLDAWRDGLRRNAALLRGIGQLNQENTPWVRNGYGREPLWVWPQYRAERLVYDPRPSRRAHGGRTKEDLLAAEARGWDVLLVEGDVQNVPREGQGQTVGGRTQLECGRTPAESLAALRTRGETGLTPEAYAMQFLDALERRGQVLDTQTFSYLLGAYLPTSRHVPDAYWLPEVGRAYLFIGDAGSCSPSLGPRAAVRVV